MDDHIESQYSEHVGKRVACEEGPLFGDLFPTLTAVLPFLFLMQC